MTHAGKLPNSFGFPSGKVQGGGVIRRKLTKKELSQQKALQKSNTRF